jgi:hypothetical protein
MRPLFCLETSETSYPETRRNIPKESIPQLSKPKPLEHGNVLTNLFSICVIKYVNFSKFPFINERLFYVRFLLSILASDFWNWCFCMCVLSYNDFWIFFTVCHCLTIYIHIFVVTNYWQHFPGFIYIAGRVSVFIPSSSRALVHCNRPWFTIHCSFSLVALFLFLVHEHLKLVKITVTVSLVLYLTLQQQ